jgi:hypothetical protein
MALCNDAGAWSLTPVVETERAPALIQGWLGAGAFTFWAGTFQPSSTYDVGVAGAWSP